MSVMLSIEVEDCFHLPRNMSYMIFNIFRKGNCCTHKIANTGLFVISFTR
ncbi:hypothetical protein MtrunA17_Chr7g0251021 [Medicago truncatula]|uniref:Uncharacterized protein n=1 Tax=Medicago truncatula TaxID=3880 RepID=A0A396H1Z2_MEDTR|nr:hypothetical protein MtrunA17_Chr7g0251021 [Medicago truncatula]